MIWCRTTESCQRHRLPFAYSFTGMNFLTEQTPQAEEMVCRLPCAGFRRRVRDQPFLHTRDVLPVAGPIPPRPARRVRMEGEIAFFYLVHIGVTTRFVQNRTLSWNSPMLGDDP